MDIQMNPERFHVNCLCNTCIEHSIKKKEFKNNIDAICYKYILLLKIKSKYY